MTVLAPVCARMQLSVEAFPFGSLLHVPLPGKFGSLACSLLHVPPPGKFGSCMLLFRVSLVLVHLPLPGKFGLCPAVSSTPVAVVRPLDGAVLHQ